MLYRFERYNGMGYRQFHNPSPYLWNFLQIYRAGKFATDGYHDPTAVSNPCGSAMVMKALASFGA